MATWLGRHRPGPVAKLVLRLPLALHRIGLGRLMGRRFVVISNRGRKTGRLRLTPVEVLDYRPELDEIVVITPWPDHSDWYRNLRANPAEEIWVGGRRFRPVQRFMQSSEVADALDAYARKHPVARLGLKRLLRWSTELSPDERESIAAGVAGVAFRRADT